MGKPMTREEFSRLPRNVRKRAATLARNKKKKDQIAEYRLKRELAQKDESTDNDDDHA